MGVLIFLFWCVVAFWLLGLAGRLLLRSYVRRRTQQFNEQFGGAQQQRRQRGASSGQRPEGEVRIERIEAKEKHVSGKVGEYVEYEEIDEKKVK